MHAPPCSNGFAFSSHPTFVVPTALCSGISAGAKTSLEQHQGSIPVLWLGIAGGISYRPEFSL